MKVLIVDDDALSAKVMQKFLEPYGECVIAIDGFDALEHFRTAIEERKPYDLICLDIMMPQMSGQEVLEDLRAIEGKRGIRGRDGVTVIMTTAMGDPSNIMEAFRSQCEGYLVKPIHREKLLNELKSLGLLK